METGVFNGLLQGPSYYWGADVGVWRGLKSKIVLKICWKSSSKYWLIEDKDKTTGKAIKAARVGAHDMAEMVLPSVGAAGVSPSLLPRERFWERMHQAENQAIEQDKELW